MSERKSTAASGSSLSELARLDAWAFCRAGSVLEGLSKSEDFARFHESVLHPSDSSSPGIRWRMSGRVNALRHSEIEVSGDTVVTLPCMRCGKPIEHAIELARVLRLCKSEQQADEVAAGDIEGAGLLDEAEDLVDPVVCTGYADARQWLEDELLLSLPMFVRHSDCEPDLSDLIEQTNAKNTAGASQDGSAQGNEADAKTNPFAVLSALKKNKGESAD